MNLDTLIGAAKAGVKSIKIFTHAHSAALFTGFGIAGFVSAIPLTLVCKAKADQLFVQAETDKYEAEGDYIKLTNYEKFKIWAEAYWPVAADVVLSTTAIIMGQRVQIKRTEALEAAFVAGQKELATLKKKTEEELGKKKAQVIQDKATEEIAKEYVHNASYIEETGFGDQVCVELLTGRVFKCNIESIRRAAADTNVIMIDDPMDTLTPLNTFYDRLGLRHSGIGSYMCWSYTADGVKLEIQPTSIYDETTGQAILAYGFNVDPMYDARLGDGFR